MMRFENVGDTSCHDDRDPAALGDADLAPGL